VRTGFEDGFQPQVIFNVNGVLESLGADGFVEGPLYTSTVVDSGPAVQLLT
jgi:hypothetical protein